MQKALRSDLRLVIVLVCVCVLSALVVWQLSYRKELDQLVERALVERQLMLGRLFSDLQRYQDLAVSLADDPRLTGLGPEGANPAADAFLVSAADKTAARAIYFVDDAGQVLASSTTLRPEDLAHSPYFQRAMDGALGASFDRDDSFGARLFQYAAPAFDSAGKVRGAVIVLADAEAIEIGWRGVAMALALMDQDGKVFISNRSELLGLRRHGDGCALYRDQTRVATCRESARTWALDWGPYLPAEAVPLDSELARVNMTALSLTDVAPARQIAALQAAISAAVVGLFGIALVWATARRKVLARTNQMLEQRVADRTRALTESNAALRIEVRERKEAETALRKAQADLVQAGKLSALGQMSAGISHELNQPLMAIRQFAENGLMFLDRDKPEAARDNLGRIDRLAARAARIIRNLRAFARNESEPMGRVDLVQVIDTAIDLSAERLQQSGVVLTWQAPATPVYVRAGEVRLGQVFVNLINNAIDAMDGQADKRIGIALDLSTRPVVSVRDTGPGIADPDRIFEPFYTTKEVSDTDGMGLGLSISYGLVQSFGGNIRGGNASDGGAVFTVELEMWSEGKAGNEGKAA